MDIETRLRQDLADRAEDISAAPADLHAHVLDGHRAQRRQQLGVAALVAAVASIALLIPTALSNGGDRTATPTPSPTSSSQAMPSAAVPSPPLAPYQRYDLPPRGSLSDDPAFLQGLIERSWSATGSGPEPAVGTRQVVFAGEVPGEVQALVVGEQDGGLVGLWLHGPVGTAAGALEASNEAGPIDLGQPVARVHTENGVGAMVVIARPGDLIQVSPGTAVDGNGNITELPYQLIGDETGIGVLDAVGLPQASTSVRVTRDEQVLPVIVEGGSTGGGRYGFDLTGALVGAAGNPDQGVIQSALDYSLMMLGLDIDDVETHVLWGAPIGNQAQPDAEAAVLTVRVPSGAVLLLGWLGSNRSPVEQGGGFSYAGPCAIALLPANTNVQATGMAMTCELFDPNGAGKVLGQQLVVLPPAGTTELAATGGAGQELGTYELDGPALVAPAPDGVAAVTARDATGAKLAELPLTGRQPLGSD